MTRVSRRVVFGAVAYGVAARADPVFDPTADTALLSKALSEGGRIELEPRTYRVSAKGDVLHLTCGDTHLIGKPGTVIECDTIFDGRPETDLALLAISGHGQPLSNISLQNLTLRFTRPFANRGQKPVVYVQGVRGFTMSGVRIQFGTYGTFLRQVEDFSITGCRFEDTRADGLQGGNMGSKTLGMSLRRGLVANNTVLRSGDDAIAMGSVVGPGWTRASDIEISGNQIVGLSRLGGGIGIYGCDNALIQQNVIDDLSASHGIAVITDTNNSQTGNSVARVLNNRIRATGTTPDQRKAAIFLASRNSGPGLHEDTGPLLLDALVQGNVVEVSDRNGVWLQVPARYGPDRQPDKLRIIDNQLTYTGPRSAPMQGIHIDGARSIQIDQNTVEGFPTPWASLRRVQVPTIGQNLVRNSGPSAIE